MKTKRFFPIIPALLVLAVCSTLRAEVLLDEWARVMMGGNQIGYYHVSSEKTEEEGKNIIISLEESNFSMKRAGVVLKLTEKSETVRMRMAGSLVLKWNGRWEAI